jgi:hypothetical protein
MIKSISILTRRINYQNVNDILEIFNYLISNEKYKIILLKSLAKNDKI